MRLATPQCRPRPSCSQIIVCANLSCVFYVGILEVLRARAIQS